MLQLQQLQLNLQPLLKNRFSVFSVKCSIIYGAFFFDLTFIIFQAGQNKTSPQQAHKTLFIPGDLLFPATYL